MIVNSNPSTPEHMKSTSIVNGEQTTTGLDLNSNPLNHSQPRQLPLSHNHNHTYNQYFTNNINNNNQTNANTWNQTGLAHYPMETMANGLNPMDFIENDMPTPDETLFNLDTFDILGDMDNLDDLSQSTGCTEAIGAIGTTNGYRTDNLNLNLNQVKSIKSDDLTSSTTNSLSTAQDYRDCTANITDYSPEWCYPEGMAVIQTLKLKRRYALPALGSLIKLTCLGSGCQPFNI